MTPKTKSTKIAETVVFECLTYGAILSKSFVAPARA